MNATTATAVLHGIPEVQIILRLSVGALLGALIGFERQWRQRSAGIHTSGLVATGASLFALIGPALIGESDSRMLANIITGVGFLAGGVILRDGVSLTGINTAGTMWATAAVGAMAGTGLLREALLGAAVVITLNLLFEPLSAAIDRRRVEVQRERESNAK